MTEIRTLKEIENSIQNLLNQYHKQNDVARGYVNTVEKTLLDIGIELVYASNSLTALEFDSLKKETAESLGNDASNINKVIKVARNSAIRENKDKLPVGWTSLYLLCQIEPKHFNEFMEESKVNSSTTRSQLVEMIHKFKSTHPDYEKPESTVVKKKIERMVLKQSSVNATSSADFELALKQFLRENGWELVKPKEEPTPQSIAPTSSTVIEGEKQANNEQDFEQQQTA
jgi:hypothetical protein